jgi:hypothetical protein
MDQYMNSPYAFMAQCLINLPFYFSQSVRVQQIQSSIKTPSIVNHVIIYCDADKEAYRLTCFLFPTADPAKKII